MGLLTNHSSEVSGFYYDEQLKNPELTMTLHPNCEWDGEAMEWKPFSGNKLAGTGDKNGNWEYAKTPIATAIISEDFQVGVANEWIDGGYGNDLQQLFNSFKPIAPMLDSVGESLGAAADSSEEYTNNNLSGMNTWSRSVAGWINKFLRLGERYVPKGADYLNRSITINGSRFSMFNGTVIAFGNLPMKFTLFSDWDTSSGEPKFISCLDKVKKLEDYTISKYVEFNRNEPKDSSINQFLGWELPPGGFRANMKSLDSVQEGTLMVIFGGKYAIFNLVVQDCQLTFSKQYVKEPGFGSSNKIHPLYCDVSLTLKPASKYTAAGLTKSYEGPFIKTLRDQTQNTVRKRLRELASLSKIDSIVINTLPR